MNLQLDPVLERFVADQVTSGHFSNADQVVRAALHLLAEMDLDGRREAIRAELADRMEDGAATLSADDVFGRIEARYEATAGRP